MHITQINDLNIRKNLVILFDFNRGNLENIQNRC